jgi:hypothetical protein
VFGCFADVSRIYLGKHGISLPTENCFSTSHASSISQRLYLRSGILVSQIVFALGVEMLSRARARGVAGGHACPWKTYRRAGKRHHLV